VSELDPTPELPNETPLDRVRFPSRIRDVLSLEGLQTVGQVRETPDATLLSVPDLGPRSVAHLRETLGLASMEGEQSV
jgi:DNA-directed RNA polymerase alpha subunit